MLVIKATTKKGRQMLESAKNYEGYYLQDVYGTCSHAKQNAWDYCYNQCQKENGSNFHIISHNTFQFSVAWETNEGTRIETSCNSYLIA